MGATTIAGLFILGVVVLMARRPAADWQVVPIDEPPKHAARPKPPQVQLRVTQTTEEYQLRPMHVADRRQT
jgi:hypothetical protein